MDAEIGGMGGRPAAPGTLDETMRTIETTIDVPVVVSVGVIRRRWRILAAQAGSPVIVCGTNDGRVTTWRNLDDALGLANDPGRGIETVSIRSERGAASARVEFFVRNGRSARVHVCDEETMAERLFDALEQAVSRAKREVPGYRWFAAYGHGALRLAAAMAAVYVFLDNDAVLLELAGRVAFASVRDPWAGAVAVPLAAGATAWGLAWMDRRVRAAIRRYWPMVVVEMGNGRARARAAARVRKTALAFAGAVVAGMVATVLVAAGGGG